MNYITSPINSQQGSETVMGSKKISSLSEVILEDMQKQKYSYVQNFTTDSDQLVELLKLLGTPLNNYSSLSELAKDDPHPCLNKVRYKQISSGAQSVHYVSEELRIHSARSWLSPRPRYFVMLMVEPGWADEPTGRRGESKILEWRLLFEGLSKQDGDLFQRHISVLRNTPLQFLANNVREPLSTLPLIYELEDSCSEFDLGVRLKQDLDTKIHLYSDSIPDFSAYKAALTYLFEKANDSQFIQSWSMKKGDLIIIDNDRFGHGRKSIVGVRDVEGITLTNPRELWSVAIA